MLIGSSKVSKLAVVAKLTIAIASVARLKADMEQDKINSYGKAVKSARQLVHIVLGKAWEDTSSIFRQIDSVGPKAAYRSW